ncbi:unnamed protein product [Knipowitschia caucasica]
MSSIKGNCSTLSTTNSSSMHPDNDQTAAYSRNVEPEEDRSGRPLTEGIEGLNVDLSSGANCRAGSDIGVSTPDTHQITPTKRRTVLNISPPPQDLLDNSQMSCQDETFGESEQSNSIWMEDSLSNFSIMSTVSYNDNTEVPRKSRKRTPRQRPGSKSKQASNQDMFDADGAKGPHFVLSQLGSDKSRPKGSSEDGTQTSVPKGGTLSAQYPAKNEGKELKILVQPETQHRARYLTEGSRGSVKDRTQQGFPTVKLEGVNEPVVLQVFVANDSGRVKPHGFYQACRVTGRNTTVCIEVDIGGTTVIEVPLDPSTNMTLAVDCVGILKLRNADVEARIGVAGSKKKSTRARLVFRVNIPRPDGSVLTLQTPSSPILCTQPAGLPEILKKSLHSCSVRGGEEVFIIGKNFLKDTKVIFHENVSDDTSWKVEAEIDMELFHQNHLVVKVPPYQTQSITSAVCVGIYVMTNAGKSNDMQPFTYTPDAAKTDISVKTEMVSPSQECTYNNPNEAALRTPLLPLVKTEEVTPMEVTSNLQNNGIFKKGLCSQPNTNMQTSGGLNENRSYSNCLQQATGDQDQERTFTNTEQISTVQKQDNASTSTFPVPPGDSLVQQSSQQFLLKQRDSVRQDQPSSDPTGVGRLCGEAPPQPRQMSVFVLDEVAQLEEAVRHLQAKGYCRLPQSDNSLVKQQHIQNQQIQQLQQEQQQQQQQQQQVLDNLQQQLFQSQIQMHCVFQDAGQGKSDQQSSPQVAANQPSLFQQTPQQQVPMFQSNELVTIQTNFLQQTPSHPSPPMFHNSPTLGETSSPQGTLFQKSSQEQVQATLFQNSMSVLQSPDQQPATSTLFLPQTSLSSQLTSNSPQQQQQMAFLNTLQTPNPDPLVYQAQTQLSPIQQRSPMEQQPTTQSPQQATLFQNIPAHPSANPLSANQQQQPQPPGILFCSNPMSDQASSLLFSAQTPMNVTRSDRSEPMTLGNVSVPQQQIVYQEQQPMQLGNATASERESSVGLFMPSSNLASLQQDLSQELAQSSLFTTQNSVPSLQTTTNSPVQQPGPLFQSAVSSNISQPNQTQQPGLYMYGIQNECGQLMNPAGNTVSDQIIAISQSGQNQRESEARIQSLLNQTASVQSSMTASQNMEKMDELLVSLHDSANSLTRSF